MANRSDRIPFSSLALRIRDQILSGPIRILGYLFAGLQARQKPRAVWSFGQGAVRGAGHGFRTQGLAGESARLGGAVVLPLFYGTGLWAPRDGGQRDLIPKSGRADYLPARPTLRTARSIWAMRSSKVPVRPMDMRTRPGDSPILAWSSGGISEEVEEPEQDMRVSK